MSLAAFLDIDEYVTPVIEEIKEEKKKKISPFDFVAAINFTKEDLIGDDPAAESQYIPYIVNKSLMTSTDTILYANEMNFRPSIPKAAQFAFLSAVIRKKKRYGDWIKPEKESDDIVAIKQFYEYSTEKAKYAQKTLTNEQIATIKQKLYTGGTEPAQ